MRNINIKKLNIIFLSVMLLSGAASSALGNSSSYYDKDGSTIIPIENKNIRMQKEIVRIKADHDEDGRWLADCEFIFVNLSNSPETVTMGYPDWTNALFNPGEDKAFWDFFETLPKEQKRHYKEGLFVVGYGFDTVYVQGYKKNKIKFINSAWNLHDLSVSVDGVKAQTTHKPIDIEIPMPKANPKIYNMGATSPQGAYTWKVYFKPKETKIVKVAFSFSGLTDSGHQQAVYLLQTGALWADTIGEADIYWDTFGRSVGRKRALPPNYVIDNYVLHWHFENFEPKEDIILSAGTEDYFLAMARIFQRKKYEADKRLYGSDDLVSADIGSDIEVRQLFIKTLRNEIFARHGREFKSKDLNLIFGKCDWYKPNKRFSESMLNEYEKRNVEFILSFEKQKGW